VAEPGLPKNRLVAEILKHRRAGRRGALGRLSGHRADDALGPRRDRPAPDLGRPPDAEGESHFFEIAGVYRRYHCPLSRTLFFEEPPAKYRLAEEAVQEATAAGLAQARPGNTCEDIATPSTPRWNAMASTRKTAAAIRSA
jgi:ectoine hydrolase